MMGRGVKIYNSNTTRINILFIKHIFHKIKILHKKPLFLGTSRYLKKAYQIFFDFQKFIKNII
jgi:hypothetical protein